MALWYLSFAPTVRLGLQRHQFSTVLPGRFARHLIPARPCLGPFVFQLLRSRRLKENKRADKWRTMIDSFDDWRRGKKAKRLRNRVRKGVPDCVRGKVWQMLSGSTVSGFLGCGTHGIISPDDAERLCPPSCIYLPSNWWCAGVPLSTLALHILEHRWSSVCDGSIPERD